jgi:hypothetical protein
MIDRAMSKTDVAAAIARVIEHLAGWTVEKVAKMAWAPGSNGFSGECCGHCNTTLNTTGGGSGWFCPKCEHFNCQSFTYNRPIHEEPDFGPPRVMIRAGYDLAAERAEKARKFKKGDRVIVDTRCGGPSYIYPRNDRPGTVVALDSEFGIPAPGCQAYRIEFDDGDSGREVFWEKYMRAA